MYKGSPGMMMHMMRRDYENFAGGSRLKSALMGASKTLLEEALSARAPGIDKVSSEPGLSSEEDEDEEAATPPARKRPAAAPPTVSKKRRPAPSKPTGVPKHIRYRWVPIKLLKGVGGERSETPGPAQTAYEHTPPPPAGGPLGGFPIVSSGH